MNGNFRRWNSTWAGPAIAFTFLLLLTCPISISGSNEYFSGNGQCRRRYTHSGCSIGNKRE